MSSLCFKKSNLKNLLILAGGPSVEHEISLMSAAYIESLVDLEVYCPIRVLIGRDKVWRKADSQWKALEEVPLTMVSYPQGVFLVQLPQEEDDRSSLSLTPIDMVFPIVHGSGGEDGTLQGYLKTLGVPFVGNNTLASAVAMDKEVMKMMWACHDLPFLPFFVLHHLDQAPSYQEAVLELESKTLFVKPCSLGSSVGISKVTDAQSYQKALALAFRFDEKVMVEQEAQGREIECAVLGNDDLIISGPGEILIKKGAFYDYTAKYFDPQAADVVTKASLSPEEVESVKELAAQAFRALGCSGLARVDFFLTKEGLFLNELNTVPGFTQHSLYPKLLEEEGIMPQTIMKTLIHCAEETFKRQNDLQLIP